MDSFATPAELSAYSKGAISASDARAVVLLAGASTAIRRYCGWHIAPSIDQTVKLDGPGGRVLSLRTKFLTALPTITEDGIVLVDEIDYRWSELGEVRKTGSVVPWPRDGLLWTEDYRALELTFTHGYALEPDPDDPNAEDAMDLKSIVLAVCSRALSSPTGATREQAGTMSVMWAAVAPGVAGGLALLAHEMAIVDTYRIEGI